MNEKDFTGIFKNATYFASAYDGVGLFPKELYLKHSENISTQPLSLPFEMIMDVPMNTKTCLEFDSENIFAKICKNGFISRTVCIMPDIVDVRISEGKQKTNKVVFVVFGDGTVEKAILSDEDTFSLEQGISICITKKLLADKCGSGSSVYNKIIKKALKVFNKKEHDRLDKLAQQKQEEKKLAKIKEKKELRRIKQEQAERERQIEIYKEAYLRAMREYKNTETGQGE